MKKNRSHIIKITVALFLGWSFLGIFSVMEVDVLWAAKKGPRKMTVKKGLNSLKKNYVHAKANLNEYKKNLNIVDENLNEMDKVLKMIEEQQQQVQQALKEHQRGLRSLVVERKDSSQLITKEQQLLGQEKNYQIKLQKLMQLLQKREKTRSTNIQFYQKQLEQMAESEKTIKANLAKINKNLKMLGGREKGINKGKQSWLAKKKGYIQEVDRWVAEVKKHEKLYNNYKGLKGKNVTSN